MTGEIVRGIVQGSPKARVSAAQWSPVVHLGKEAEEEEQVQHLGGKRNLRFKKMQAGNIHMNCGGYPLSGKNPPSRF